MENLDSNDRMKAVNNLESNEKNESSMNNSGSNKKNEETTNSSESEEESAITDISNRNERNVNCSSHGKPSEWDIKEASVSNELNESIAI